MLPNCRMQANLEICHDNREGNKGWGRNRLKIIAAAHSQKGFMLIIHVVQSVLVGILYLCTSELVCV